MPRQAGSREKVTRMSETVIEPLKEAKRWHGRDVKYWAGTWTAVSALIPKFEISDFTAEAGSPANPYMTTVVRLPRTLLEQRVPVGVVSKSYTLAQHQEVAEQCFEGIRQTGVNPANLRCEVGLTDLGEWMNLRIYFPEEQDFVHAKDDRMKLRVECYNSVDGSCRVVVLFGWLRFVCTNGLVILDTRAELREIHDGRLDLHRIPEIIRDGMKEVRNDEARMRRWIQTVVQPKDLVPWANEYVSDAWGKKAACRVFHICRNGYDVEFDDPFASGEACDKPVHKAGRVPGSPPVAANLFDVSQALSWVATARNNPDERLDWQARVPRLVSQLEGMWSAGRDGGQAHDSDALADENNQQDE